MSKKQSFSILAFLLVATCLLNFGDYFFTVRAFKAGYQELNPLMDAILGTPYFSIVKLGVIPLLIAILWWSRRYVDRLRLHLYAAVVFVSYLGIVLHHTVFFPVI